MTDTSLFEHVSCLFHPEAPAEKLFQRPDWWFELPGDFAWNRCPQCGLLFLSPRPKLSAIEEYYPNAYAAYRTAIDDERWFFMRWKRRRNLRPQVEAVERLAPPGKLLDVGCATGNYLAEMRRHGWQVHGVELQADAAQYARDRLALDVFTGDLLDASFPPNSFDVITMWDVLEHTFDPLSILQRIRQLLKPGGHLIFSIPDLRSKEAASFGPAWIGYDAPRHLYLFGNDSLDLLLSGSGFHFVAGEHTLATYHTWAASFHTAINQRHKNGPWRRLLLKLAYLPIWSPLAAPYFQRLNRSGSGTVITISAAAESEKV